MKTKRFKFLLILLVSLTLMSACSNPLSKAMETKESSIFQVAEVENCRITSNSANVKNGAGATFYTTATLNKGDIVDVLGSLGDWYVIRLDNNLVGCISAADATPVVQEEQPPKPTQPEEEIQQQPQRTAGEDIGPAERLTSIENRMVELVNQERKKNGLQPLKVDWELSRVARIKSQDMVDNNYFSHYSPTYGSPFDMIKNFGINYLYAGENLAGNSTVERAQTSLMNSSGHRRNILNPNFTYIGVGVKPSDRFGYVFTQMFISKPH